MEDENEYVADPDNLDAAEAHAANARKQMAALNACKDIVMLLSAESVPVLAGAASALFNLALDSANAEALHSLGAMQQLHMHHARISREYRCCRRCCWRPDELLRLVIAMSQRTRIAGALEHTAPVGCECSGRPSRDFQQRRVPLSSARRTEQLASPHERRRAAAVVTLRRSPSGHFDVILCGNLRVVFSLFISNLSMTNCAGISFLGECLN